MCCCIFYAIVKFFIVIGLAIFIFWLAIRPTKIVVQITDASLYKFQYKPPKNLNYNLALNISFENPNKWLEADYEKVQVRTWFEGEIFGLVSLDSFKQKPKTNTSLNIPVIKGEIELGGIPEDKLEKLMEEKSYNLFLDCDVEMKFKLIRIIKSFQLKPKIECKMEDVPLICNGVSSADKSQVTMCSVFYLFKWRSISI